MQVLPFWLTAAWRNHPLEKKKKNRTEKFSLSGHRITVPYPFYLHTGRDLTSPQPDLSGSGNTPVTGQADHGAIIVITHHYLYMVVHYGLCLYNFTDSPIRTVPDALSSSLFPVLRTVL